MKVFFDTQIEGLAVIYLLEYNKCDILVKIFKPGFAAQIVSFKTINSFKEALWPINIHNTLKAAIVKCLVEKVSKWRAWELTF